MADGTRKTAGTRGGAGRLAAMAIALALGLLLVLAGEARADPTEFVPIGLEAEGGGGWHGSNEFNVFWTNPGAGPVIGAAWTLSGGGQRWGPGFAPGIGISELRGLRLPAAGTYRLLVWLRFYGGFESPEWEP